MLIDSKARRDAQWTYGCEHLWNIENDILFRVVATAGRYTSSYVRRDIRRLRFCRQSSRNSRRTNLPRDVAKKKYPSDYPSPKATFSA